MTTVVGYKPVSLIGDRVSQVELEMDDGTTIIHFLTTNDIAMHVLANMELDEVAALSRLEESDLIHFHHTTGAYIRNQYNLWHDHCPLTKNNPIIIDGVDINPMHPDHVSSVILHEMWTWAKSKAKSNQQN